MNSSIRSLCYVSCTCWLLLFTSSKIKYYFIHIVW